MRKRWFTGVAPIAGATAVPTEGSVMRGTRAAKGSSPRDRRREMHTNRYTIRRGGIALALVAAVVLALGGATSSSATPLAGGPPDTYVANWDAVGTQAFSAAGLSPAEGHVIFAYVAIAVYDSVMAVKGGHEPFRSTSTLRRTPRPRPPSPPPRVACWRTTCLRRRASSRLHTPRLSAASPTVPPRRTASRWARLSQTCSSFSARTTGSGRTSATHRRARPDPATGSRRRQRRPSARISVTCGRSASPPRIGSAPRARLPSEARSGPTSTTRSRPSARTRPRRHGPPTRRPQLGSGPRPRSAGTRFVPQVHPRPSARRGGRRTLHGDGLRDVRRRADRLLRREVHVRALAPDHGDPRGRHRRQPCDGRRPRLDAAASRDSEPPRVPERALVHHAGRWSRDRAFPEQPADRLHHPERGDPPAARHFATPDALTDEVSNARIWGGIHFRSAVEEGVKISKRTADYVLAHDFHASTD